MTRKCRRFGCPELSIEDGRECRDHTNETLRETRNQSQPISTWRRRLSDPVAMGATISIAKDFSGARS